jgi:hypothetical protein
MRKTFPLRVEGRDPARLVESIKYAVKKYLKRERRKPLPAGADFWEFGCQVGQERDAAEAVHLGDLNHAIDAGVAQEWTTLYVEVLAKPGHRTKKPQPTESADDD